MSSPSEQCESGEVRGDPGMVWAERLLADLRRLAGEGFAAVDSGPPRG